MTGTIILHGPHRWCYSQDKPQGSDILNFIRRVRYLLNSLQYKSEFHEVSGTFEIGRTVTTKVLRREIQSNPSAQKLWTSNFGDLPPARIKVGSVIASNLFVFAPNDTCHLPLVDNEVEIRVEAVGISLANHNRTIRKL
ncbi:predicted protein [Botrytis cinerea T4]|uniref:Uncharacterized protein n=1 Tax=Botryotinia fuckeliana (strain T4) TaxID=999810 RepID=G2YL19_BOTF4|nr:predicted protein [Botrytis cinerea T4]